MNKLCPLKFNLNNNHEFLQHNWKDGFNCEKKSCMWWIVSRISMSNIKEGCAIKLIAEKEE